jgi:hypothetical protein
MFLKKKLIEASEDKVYKTKKYLNKFKDIIIHDKNDDFNLIHTEKEIASYNKAINEFKNGESVPISEYLRKRKIDV